LHFGIVRPVPVRMIFFESAVLVAHPDRRQQRLAMERRLGRFERGQ
jgi:hypothetical protein